MYHHDCCSQGTSILVVRADMTVTDPLTMKVGESLEELSRTYFRCYLVKVLGSTKAYTLTLYSNFK